MSANQPDSAEPAAGHYVVILDEQAKRRNVVYAILATIIGGVVGLFPFLSGLALFLDPALKKRKTAVPTPGSTTPPVDTPVFRRLATFDSLPEDGTPIQVPVIADLKDIWTVEPNQPIGAVYLRRVGNEVECFNAICPHAGCFVSYAATRKVYQCPCHNSAFATTGARILPSPSPRDMDKLEIQIREVEDGADPKADKKKEVWVAFANFYPGKEHPERKPS